MGSVRYSLYELRLGTNHRPKCYSENAHKSQASCRVVDIISNYAKGAKDTIVFPNQYYLFLICILASAALRIHEHWIIEA